MCICVRATVFGVTQFTTSTDKHGCANTTLNRRVTNISHFNGLTFCAKLNSATQYKNSYQLLPPGHTLGVESHRVPTSSVVFPPTLSSLLTLSLKR